MSLFVDEDLAATVERAEADLTRASSQSIQQRHGVPAFQIPVAGGVATYSGPDSPFNKVAGVGFDGLPSQEQLGHIEDRFRSQRAAVSFEVSTLADPALHELLTARGYRLVGFENVLLLSLEDLAPAPAAAGGIEVQRAEDEPQVWLDVAVNSALSPDDAGIAQHETFARDVLRQGEMAMADAGARLYLATVDGRPAGAAGVRFAGAIAQLTGAGTLPQFRRRGVQKALARSRLHDARAAGCRYAVVTTQPGSTSHANMQKTGFDLAYSRAVLVNSP